MKLQKTGNRILARVRDGLKHVARNGSVVGAGEFWSAAGRKLSAVRNRRNAALPLRRAAMIAPTEYRLAIWTIIFEAVAISRSDLVVRLHGCLDSTGRGQTSKRLSTNRVRLSSKWDNYSWMEMFCDWARPRQDEKAARRRMMTL